MPIIKLDGKIKQTGHTVSNPDLYKIVSSARMFFSTSTYKAEVNQEDNTVKLTEHYEYVCPEGHPEHNEEYDHVDTYEVTDANFELQLFADALVDAKGDCTIAIVSMAMKTLQKELEAQLEAQAANQDNVEKQDEEDGQTLRVGSLS